MQFLRYDFHKGYMSSFCFLDVVEEKKPNCTFPISKVLCKASRQMIKTLYIAKKQQKKLNLN